MRNFILAASTLALAASLSRSPPQARPRPWNIPTAPRASGEAAAAAIRRSISAAPPSAARAAAASAIRATRSVRTPPRAPRGRGASRHDVTSASSAETYVGRGLRESSMRSTSAVVIAFAAIDARSHGRVRADERGISVLRPRQQGLRRLNALRLRNARTMPGLARRRQRQLRAQSENRAGRSASAKCSSRLSRR